MGSLLDLVYDLVIAAVIGRVITMVFRALFGSATPHDPRFSSGRRAEPEARHGETVRDPVCGMFVSTELAKRLDWHGKALYFCSEECLEQYRKSAVA